MDIIVLSFLEKSMESWQIYLVVVLFVAHLLYLIYLFSIPRRIRTWAEAQGFVVHDMTPIRKDSRWNETDSWWIWELSITDIDGKKRTIKIRCGGIMREVYIMEQPERKN